MTTENLANPASTAPRRPLRADAERNRLRIIAAARTVFAERGLEVSLDDVAEAAGVGVGTVYRRFANRDELIFGVFLEHLKQVHASVIAAIDADDPWEAIVELMTSLCQMMSEDRGLAAIIMQIDHANPEIEVVKGQMTQAIQALVERAKRAEVLRPDLVANDFFVFFTMLSSVAQTTQTVAPGTWRRYLDLILDAIRAEPQREPLRGSPLSDDQLVAIRQREQCGDVGR